MKLPSNKSFNNLNAILSFISTIVAIIQVCLHVQWFYYLITIGTIILLWISYIIFRISNRPWYTKLSNPLIRRTPNTPYTLNTFYAAMFKKPYYHAPFMSPKYSHNMSQQCTHTFDTSRLTVVIEDDPVGYMDNIGMLPCIPIEDEILHSDLYKRISNLDEETSKYNMFFIATPSRRLDKAKSHILNREIGYALRKYFENKPNKKRIISKIDSCLRSNYEAEYNGLTEGLGIRNCIEIIIPSYIEQGRVTMHGCQYVKQNGNFILMTDSEYSSFKGLEYSYSDIAMWLEERVPHIHSRKNIGLIDIDILRNETVEDIIQRIISASNNGIKAFVIDSVEKLDLVKSATIIQALEEIGETLFLKLGPSMINMLAKEYAIPKQPTTLSSINVDDRGIFIAGSLTSITKQQIETYDDFANTSIVTVRESDLNNIKDIDIVIRNRSNNIIKKNKDGDDVILTTEYWKTDKNEYPDIQKRDLVISVLSKICQQIR